MYIKTLFIILALASLACTLSNAAPSSVGSAMRRTAFPTKPPTAEPCLRAQTDLYIRAAPSELSPVLFWLYEGNTAQIIEPGTEWTRIVGGFVRTKYTEPCQ